MMPLGIKYRFRTEDESPGTLIVQLNNGLRPVAIGGFADDPYHWSEVVRIPVGLVLQLPELFKESKRAVEMLECAEFKDKENAVEAVDLLISLRHIFDEIELMS